MRRKQIIIAVSIAVLAINWTGIFWSKIAWPLLQRGFQETPANGPAPVVAVRTDVPNQWREIPPTEEIVGIGAVLRYDNDAGLPLVMNTVPGSPAERAGLKAGLLVQKVNDTPLAGLPLAECINLIRGPVGSKVRIEVRDSEQNTVIPFELKRERLQLGRP